MSVVAVAKDWRWLAAGAASALVTAFLIAGWPALAGMALGLAAATVSVVGLWWAVKTVGTIAPYKPKSTLGAIVTVTVFVIKLPLFYILGKLAMEISGPALPAFMIAIALVYFALVGWALAQG